MLYWPQTAACAALRRSTEGGAQPLCSLTGDIHLHTLVCPDEARKARVLAALEEKG